MIKNENATATEVDEISAVQGTADGKVNFHGLDKEDLQAMIAIDPKLKDDKDIQEALKTFDEVLAQAAKPAAKPKEDVPPPVAKAKPASPAKDPSQEEEDEEDGEQQEEEDKPNPDDILGLSKPVATPKFEIKAIEDIPSIIEKQFGIKADTPVDALQKLQTSFNKTREQAKGAGKLQETLDNMQAGLDALPPAVIAAINAAARNPRGKDWIAAFNENLNTVDFEKPFADYSPKEIFAAYFPDVIEGLTDEQIKDYKNDPVLKRVFTTAEQTFNLGKKDFETQRDTNLETDRTRKAQFDSSITSAADSLSAKYPAADRKVVKELQALLKDRNAVMSTFYDVKGNPKSDALINLFMAKYGEKQLQSTLQKEIPAAENRGKGKATKDIVSRGADKPRSEGTPAPTGIEDKEMQDLFALTKEDDPYANLNTSGAKSRRAN